MYCEGYNLCVSLLGGFRVWIDGEEIPASSWRLRKVKSLFKLLSLTPEHYLHREQLMELLWPDQDAHSAANNLNQVLYHARRSLCAEGSTNLFLQLRNELLYLNPDSRTWVDVEEFKTTVIEARKSQDPAIYQQAIALYTGDLLPEDPYEDWAIARREELKQEYLKLLLDLAHLNEAQGNFTQAISVLSQLVIHDPLREDVHTDLMRLHTLNGSRSAAFHQYQLLTEILQRELGVKPEPATVKLFEDIVAGRLEPVAGPVLQNKPTGRHHNLPLRLSSFIGRTKEIVDVQQLFEVTRLVTLIGSGGVGKTRLAIQVGFAMLDGQPDGVWLADLAPVMDQEFVSQTVAGLFKPNQDGQHSSLQVLKDFLQSKSCLLILDNCEHLIDATAQLAENLLYHCPKLKILVTSREGLGSEGERIYIVPSLACPELMPLPPVEKLKAFDAVRLFVDRVQQQLPEFSINENNAQAVAQICQRLDGIPLAIELAAGRAGLLRIDQIAARLDDRFRLLTGGSRTGLSRQRTLQASIDWSYDLLTSQEKILLRRLSIFSGRWVLDAAEQIASDSHEIHRLDILDLVSSLVHKSLVIVGRRVGKISHYHMLETVRNYAQDKLEAAGELEMLRDRHLAYYLYFVEQLAPKLKSAGLLEAMAQLRAELDNLRGALSWSLQPGDDTRLEIGLKLANGLTWFWERAMLEEEGRFWLKKGLALIQATGSHTPSLKGYTLCHLAGLHHDLIELQRMSEESVAIFREIQDMEGLARALLNYGGAISTYDQVNANRMLDESIGLYRKLSKSWELAYALKTQSRIAENAEDDLVVEALAQESFDLFLETGDLWQAYTGPVGLLANIAARRGDFEKAESYIQKSAQFASESLDADLAWTLHYMGTMNYYLGDFHQMETNFRLTLEMVRETSNELCSVVWILRFIGISLKRQYKFQQALSTYLDCLSRSKKFFDPYGIYASIAGIAGVLIAQGQSIQGTTLLGNVDAFFSTFTKPMDRIDRIEYDRDIAAAQEALSEGEYSQAWETGHFLSKEVILQEVFSLRDQIQAAVI